MSDVSLAQPGDSTPDAPTSAGDQRATARATRYAGYVFWLMFIINFLNYLDRWVFTGLSVVIQQDLKLDDFQLGLLGSAFLLVYTIVALPLGFLADRISRKLIVAAGVAIWSLSTIFTGIAGNFATMLGVRSILGIGEGSYYPAGTPLLAAYTPPARRATTLARWGVGALLGAAVGFLLAAPFASVKPLFIPGVPAWRLAFLFTGVPGLVLALLIWRTRDKVRHEQDPAPSATRDERSFLVRLGSYLRIPTVRVIIGTHAFGFFALTGVTAFLPLYLNSVYGRSVAAHDATGRIITVAGPYGNAGLSAGLISILAGGLVVLGGVLGNLYGGTLADRLAKQFAGGRVFAGGLGFLLAAPCVAIAIGSAYILRLIPTYMHANASLQINIGVGVFAVFALLGAFCLNMYNGPLSAALLDVVPPSERGSAGGAELTLAHLLGDIYATAALGALAGALVNGQGVEQIGLALLLTCPFTLVAAGVIGMWGSRFYASDVRNVASAA